MTIIGVILVCATLQFVIAFWCFALSWADGWSHFRFLALSAAAMGFYALMDLIYITSVMSDATVAIAIRLSLVLGLVCLGALMTYHRRSRGERLRAYERVILWGMLGLGLCAAVSPWGWGEIVSIDLGVPTRHPSDGFWLNLAMFLVIGLAAVMLLDHLAAFVLRREKTAILRLVGFLLFFAAIIGEALNVLELVAFPAFADLGFSALMLTTAMEISLRVIRDAKALRELNQALEERVDERGTQLVVARESLLLAERQAAIGQLAASVGHEINNPLTYMMVNLELLRTNLGKQRGEARFTEELELVSDTLEGAQRIGKIARDLTILRRSTPSGPLDAEPGEVLESAILQVRSTRPSSVEVRMVLKHTRSVRCDASRLHQIVLSLVDNALLSGTALVDVRTKDEGDGVGIEVSDHGEGIAAEILPHIFDPLFTTREVGQGTGRGLFVAKGLVELVGGRLDIASTLGVGTQVSLWLPAEGAPGRRAAR